MVSGRWSGQHRKQHSQTGPGDIRLVLPDDSEDFDFADIDVIAVRLPRSLLEDIAHARTGIRPANLRFDHFRPMSARLGRHWLHTLSYVTGTVLSDPVLQANPVLAEQARHLLAATAAPAGTLRGGDHGGGAG